VSIDPIVLSSLTAAVSDIGNEYLNGRESWVRMTDCTRTLRSHSHAILLSFSSRYRDATAVD
jgi:hypothetical protein